MFRKFKFTLSVLFLIKVAAFSQPFTPDKNGHISDPKFKALCKANGYQLVGNFAPMAESLSGKYATALKDGKWIFIDNRGKAVLQPSKEEGTGSKANREIKGDIYNESNSFNSFTYVHPSNVGLKEIVKDGKKGVINIKTGKDIVPATYDDVKLSNFGFVLVKQNGKWGTISKQGQLVTPPQYDDVSQLGVNMAGTNFITGDAVIMKKDNKWGLFSYEGKEIVQPRFDQIKNSWTISSVLTARLNDKWCLLNKDGKQLTELIYTSINTFDKIGAAQVTVKTEDKIRYGYIDTLGKELIKPVYKEITSTNYPLLVVTTDEPDEKKGILTVTGQIITKPIYKDIFIYHDKTIMVIINENGQNKKGLIDQSGLEVIKPIYEELETVGKGFYKVKLNNKYGLVNEKGIYIIKPAYNYLDSFGYKIYSVAKDKKYGMIDHTGKVLIPFIYDSGFNNYGDKKGVVISYISGKLYMLDFYGNQVAFK
jgi:hypothetical protein